MDNFETTVIKTWGNKGKEWLALLPSLVSQLAEAWHLSALEPFDNLSFNYVMQAYREQHNDVVVLKIGYDIREVLQEAYALQLYNGNGCVKLLDVDRARGAMLLEFVQPGNSLKKYFPHDELSAISAIVKVIKHLHRAPLPKINNIPCIALWLETIQENVHPSIPSKHLRQAQKLMAQLLETQGPPVLLHGDLHHENILSSHRSEWLAIDPKGVLGESAFELGAFIRNPLPELLEQKNPTAVMAQRINLFSTMLALDPQRIKAWCYVSTILAACWAEEDSNRSEQFIHLAELL